MMAVQIRPVILCGGAGLRLWPLSSATRPKPFLHLNGTSLLQATLARFNCHGFLPPIIIARAADKDLLEAELAGCHPAPAALILEPMRRNTAASVAAALALPQIHNHPDSVLLFSPADHSIGDENKFHHACWQAAGLAAADYLALLGIPPRHASTDYGYIKAGAPLIDESARQVDGFVEKPDLARAQAYAARKDYYWNSGLFCVKPDLLKTELARHAPKLLEHTQAALAEGRHETGADGMMIIRPDAVKFASLPATSIDYALLEKSRHLAMVAVEMGWLDIGSWESLHRALPQDDNGNTTKGETGYHRASGNLVWSEETPVMLADVDDLVVVATAEGIFITRRRTGNHPPASLAAMQQGLGK